MNDGRQTAAAVEPNGGSIVWRHAIAILAAAVALGLVYNIASPLGVRAPKHVDQPVAPPAHTNVASPQHGNPKMTNLAVTTTVPAAMSTNTTLLWTEVKPLLATGQIILVDARAKAAYDIEHIPGAVSLPVNSEPPDFIDFVAKYPKATPIVVYCGSDNCDLSQELAQKLRSDLGFTDVKEMPGGIAEWRVAENQPNPAGPK